MFPEFHASASKHWIPSALQPVAVALKKKPHRLLLLTIAQAPLSLGASANSSEPPLEL